jgi:hypothetical protein
MWAAIVGVARRRHRQVVGRGEATDFSAGLQRLDTHSGTNDDFEKRAATL